MSVLATDRDEVAPSWVPDGMHFPYATGRSGAYEIWLRNRQDGSYRRYIGATVEIWISALAGVRGSPV